MCDRLETGSRRVHAVDFDWGTGSVRGHGNGFTTWSDDLLRVVSESRTDDDDDEKATYEFTIIKRYFEILFTLCRVCKLVPETRR
jgi:hypothetical protein